MTEEFWELGYEVLPSGPHTAESWRPWWAARTEAGRLKCGVGETVFVEQVMGVFCYQDLARVGSVLARVRYLLGVPEVQVYYSHVTVVGPGAVAQTGNYHVDNLPAAGPDGKPRRGIKAAFYLTDVPDDKHGPLRIVPGSQGKPQPGRMDGMNVLAMAGDVVLSRPDVWHRSTFNESAVARRSLFVSYCAL